MKSSILLSCLAVATLSFAAIAPALAEPVAETSNVERPTSNVELRSFAFSAPVSAIAVDAYAAAAQVFEQVVDTAALRNTLFAAVALFLVGVGVTAPFSGPMLGLTPKPGELPANAEFSPEGFQQQIAEMKARVNAMLAGLPPLEQFEAASEMAYGIRTLQRSAADLVEMHDVLTQRATKFAESVKVTAELAAEAKLLEGGEYLKKTDAEAAATTAADQREQTVRAAIAQEATEKAEITGRREKLVTDKVVTATVAASIPDDFFKTDGFEDRLVKLTARLGKITAEKLAHSEPFMAEMVALPLDEAGETNFTARLNSAKSLVSATASRGNAGGTIPAKKPSLAGAGDAGAAAEGGEGATKPKLYF